MSRTELGKRITPIECIAEASTGSNLLFYFLRES
jgi:hypothetical protein